MEQRTYTHSVPDFGIRIRVSVVGDVSETTRRWTYHLMYRGRLMDSGNDFTAPRTWTSEDVAMRVLESFMVREF